MKLFQNKLIALITLGALTFTNIASFASDTTLTREDVYTHAQETINYYHTTYAENSYSNLMDWPAVGLSAFGEDLTSDKWTGDDGVNAVVAREKEVLKGIKLSTVKNTDFQRTIIGITAVGKDPKNFGGKNLVEIVSGTMLPNGHFADSVEDKRTKRPVGSTLINAHCFGVIAIHTAGELIPNRDKCLEWLIDKQHLDGGFTWDVKTFYDPADAELIESGIDMTAAGIMAMAILGLDQEAVPVKRALDLIKSNQNEMGGFDSWGADNPESCVWVIQALTLLGIDPMGEEWSTKDGHNPVTALLRFQLDNGSFTHVLNEKDDLPIYDNGMSTEQGLYGLAAAYYSNSVYQIQHDKYRPLVEKKLFKDVLADAPYYQVVMDAVYDYDMKGYNDGTFKPYQPIVAVKFYDALIKGFDLEYHNVENTNLDGLTYYGDLSESQWGWTSVKQLLNMNLLEPTYDFQASGTITKNQAIEFTQEVLNKISDQQMTLVTNLQASEDLLTNGDCAQLIFDIKTTLNPQKINE
jgi:hypothetical protein